MNGVPRAARIGFQIGTVVVLWASISCSQAAGARGNLNSGNPLDRARAIVEVTGARDPAAVHKLVDLLEDADPAVRMYASEALQRLCGRDYGYRFYEDEGRRAVAVERWRQALRDGEVSLQSGKTPSGDGTPARSVAPGPTESRLTDAGPATAADLP